MLGVKRDREIGHMGVWATTAGTREVLSEGNGYGAARSQKKKKKKKETAKSRLERRVRTYGMAEIQYTTGG